MKRFGPRYYKPENIKFKGHISQGVEWCLKGNKGTIHIVTMTPKGFTCDCPGMTFHGKCKHTRAIADNLDYLA
jgi:hypothetical protein